MTTPPPRAPTQAETIAMLDSEHQAKMKAQREAFEAEIAGLRKANEGLRLKVAQLDAAGARNALAHEKALAERAALEAALRTQIAQARAEVSQAADARLRALQGKSDPAEKAPE